MGGSILDLGPTSLATNPHCKTFTDIEFHQPGLLPLGNHVKIRLEPVDVVLVSNMSIQNAVVCEQTDCLLWVTPSGRSFI